MGNVAILSESRADNAILSGGLWSVPLANLRSADLTEVARSFNAALTSTQFLVDLGSAQSIAFVILGPGNFTDAAKVRVRAASNPAMSTPVYNSGFVAGLSAGFEVDVEHGAPIIHRLPATVTARFWLIEIDDSMNPAGYVELARLFMPRVYVPKINYGFDGNGLSFVSQTISAVTLGGGHVDRYRSPPRSFTVALADMPETEAYGDMFRLGSKIAYGRQVFVIADPDDTQWIEKRSFFGAIQDFSALSQASFLRVNSGMRIEEQICADVYAGWTDDPLIWKTSKPSLYANFVSGVVPATMVSTRTSAGGYFDKDGYYRSAAPGEIRIDYEPATGECLGALSEGASSNRALRSAELNNAVWDATRLSVAANQSEGIGGALTMDRLIVDNTGGSSHYVNQTIAGTDNSTPSAASIFVKAGSLARCRLYLYSTPTVARNVFAEFNLSTGAVTQTGAAGGATLIKTMMRYIGRGIWRIGLVGTLGVAETSVLFRVTLVDAAGSTGFTGDGARFLDVEGAQYEDSSSLFTSYIPTTSVAVSRTSDAVKALVSTFDLNIAEGTIYADAIIDEIRDDGSSGNILRLRSDDGLDTISMRQGTSVDGSDLAALAASVQTVNTAGRALASGERGRFAAAYKTDDFAFVKDGLSALTDSDGAIPLASTLTQLEAGGTSSSISHTRTMAYYPRRLTNAELQKITT